MVHFATARREGGVVSEVTAGDKDERDGVMRANAGEDALLSLSLIFFLVCAFRVANSPFFLFGLGMKPLGLTHYFQPKRFFYLHPYFVFFFLIF